MNCAPADATTQATDATRKPPHEPPPPPPPEPTSHRLRLCRPWPAAARAPLSPPRWLKLPLTPPKPSLYSSHCDHPVFLNTLPSVGPCSPRAGYVSGEAHILTVASSPRACCGRVVLACFAACTMAAFAFLSTASPPPRRLLLASSPPPPRCLLAASPPHAHAGRNCECSCCPRPNSEFPISLCPRCPQLCVCRVCIVACRVYVFSCLKILSFISSCCVSSLQ